MTARRKVLVKRARRIDLWLTFWGLITITTTAASLLMATRYTWVSQTTVVPVTGENVLQKSGRPSLDGAVSIEYATTEASSFLITNFRTTPDPGEVIVVIADLLPSKPCDIIGGAFLGTPSVLGRRIIPNRLGERHDVTIYGLRILPERSQLISMTCDVAAAPGADSYATRNIQYMPMPAVGPGIPAGFVPVWPQFVGFSAAGTVDLAVTGDVAPGPMASMFEEREIGPKSLTTRAHWTSVQAQAHRDLGLFLAAVIAGIAMTSLVEVLRRLFATTVAKGTPE